MPNQDDSRALKLASLYGLALRPHWPTRSNPWCAGPPATLLSGGDGDTRRLALGSTPIEAVTAALGFMGVSPEEIA